MPAHRTLCTAGQRVWGRANFTVLIAHFLTRPKSGTSLASPAAHALAPHATPRQRSRLQVHRSSAGAGAPAWRARASSRVSTRLNMHLLSTLHPGSHVTDKDNAMRKGRPFPAAE